MPIKTTKIKSKKNDTEESSYDVTKREMKEEYTRKVKEAEAKKIAESDEKLRKEAIIKAYLDKLVSQLKEKKLLGFWTFADRIGFKKFNSTNKKIDKMIKGDTDKYLGRQFAEYTIISHHNEKSDSLHRSEDLWFSVTIRIYNVVKKSGEIVHTLFNSCNIVWNIDDFNVTKFSLKLAEKFMKPLAENKLSCVSLMGLPLHVVLKIYEENSDVDFSDALQPLKGV